MSATTSMQPSMTTMTGPSGSEPGLRQKHQKRLGLIPVRIGAEIPHKLSIDLPVAEPDYSTKVTRRARSGIDNKFVYGENKLDIPIGAPPGTKGTACPVAVKKGQTVIQAVVDGTRDEFLTSPEADKIKYCCLHEGCVGKKWDNLQSLKRSHPTDKEMAANGETHAYYGAIEIAATKDPKTGAEEPAVLILASADT